MGLNPEPSHSTPASRCACDSFQREYSQSKLARGLCQGTAVVGMSQHL